MTITPPQRKLRELCAVLLLGSVLASTAHAQGNADAPEPYHSSAEVAARLYGAYLPQQAQRLEQASNALEAALRLHCKREAPLAQAQAAWQDALAAWDGMYTVPVGPLLQRRSQRRIDFWPTRPALIERGVNRAPATLDDMALVGTPAKGLPGLEWLLWKHAPLPGTPACGYAELAAADVAAEAHALTTELSALRDKDWRESPEEAGAALGEWLNQWLGGLERLRWQHMEKPLRSAQPGKPPEWPRATSRTDADSWRRQWQVLRAQAVRADGAAPDVPLSIEGLLLGQGHMDVARHWATATKEADDAFSKLPRRAPEDARQGAAVLSAGTKLKALSALFQAEVAPALNVMLGFSDADGD